jgi:hypothetical protein
MVVFIFDLFLNNFIAISITFWNPCGYLFPLAISRETLNIASIGTLRKVTTHLIKRALILIHLFPFGIEFSCTRAYKCLFMLKKSILLSGTIKATRSRTRRRKRIANIAR